MSMTRVKGDLMNCVHDSLGSVASVYFLKRAISMIEASPDDKESLWEASCKVGRLTELFIDIGLAEQVRRNLRTKIEEQCAGGPLRDSGRR